MNAESVLKRALVVEDYEPFRRFLCSELQGLGALAICEESDGIDAVKKAHELEPDLVVLDMNIPRLSGFEVARKIRVISPRSKILMLTSEWSFEFVEEAFRSGASGYLVKSLAGGEFLAAVRAVLRDTRFFCSQCRNHNFPAAIR